MKDFDKSAERNRNRKKERLAKERVRKKKRNRLFSRAKSAQTRYRGVGHRSA